MNDVDNKLHVNIIKPNNNSGPEDRELSQYVKANHQTKNKQENKYLIFQLHDLLYGIDIENVTEIIEYTLPTKVPNLPLFVHGLLNLRGKILPVIDFNLYLDKNQTVISKKTCIVIVNYLLKEQINSIGILVDNVLDVLEVQADILETPPDFGSNIKPEFVKNMFIWNNKIIVLLKIDSIFIQPILEQQ